MDNNRILMRASAAVAEGRAMLTGMKENLEGEFGDKSEKWQESDKGQEMQDAIGLLDDLAGRLEDIETEIESLKKE